MSDKPNSIHIDSGDNMMIGQGARAFINSARAFDFGRLATSSDDNHQQLKRLFKELAEMLAVFPPEQRTEVEVVQAVAQDALDEAAKESPNPHLLKIKGENLIDAVQQLADTVPTFDLIAVQIAKTLLLIG